MQIAPVMFAQARKNTISNMGLNTGSFGKNSPYQRHYTGNPSHDLALASMYDSKIAAELKSMNLIA